jgi:hydroxypyruvate isomerase
MQIMEGDVIRTIGRHGRWIGHFHTGGVPGRHDIDDTQELNYHAVAQAIADGGFEGYIAHEFTAKGEPYAGLAAACQICRV